MGEDALRLLGEYQAMLHKVMGIVGREIDVLKESLKW